MKNKRTVVFAASLKSDRYSNLAVVRLKENGFEAIPVGFRAGKIEGIDIYKASKESIQFRKEHIIIAVTDE